MPGSAPLWDLPGMHRPRRAAGPPERSRRTRGVIGLAGILAVLGACAPGFDEEGAAQNLVVGLLGQRAMTSYTQDIDAFARAADAAADPGIVLIGIDRTGTSDVLGHLTFAVVPHAPTGTTQDDGWFIRTPEGDWDPGPYCFRVAFGAYGPTGEFGTMDGIDRLDCPDDTTRLTPPPSTEPAVAEGSREAAQQILAALPAAGTLVEDDIAAQIDALLPVEVEGRPAAQARVLVEGSDVGVAMGGQDDCVLVARISGTVTDIYPPGIYLEVGELGCRPGTALTRDLRPPH